MDQGDREILELVSKELNTMRAEMRAEIQAVRADIAREMAPLLRWKAGLVALGGIIIAMGFMARAADWIIQLLHQR